MKKQAKKTEKQINNNLENVNLQETEISISELENNNNEINEINEISEKVNNNIDFEKFDKNEFLQNLCKNELDLLNFINLTYTNVSIDVCYNLKQLIFKSKNLLNLNLINSEIDVKEKLNKINIKVSDFETETINKALKEYETKIKEFSFTENEIIMNKSEFFKSKENYLKNTVYKSYFNYKITKSITKYFNVVNKLFNYNTYNIFNILSDLNNLKVYLLNKFSENESLLKQINSYANIKISKELIENEKFTANTNARNESVEILNKINVKFNNNLFTSMQVQIKKLFNLNISETFYKELNEFLTV